MLAPPMPRAHVPRGSVEFKPARISAIIAVFERPSVTSGIFTPKLAPIMPPCGEPLNGAMKLYDPRSPLTGGRTSDEPWTEA